MAKCSLCGKKIKPYFDVCGNCYNDTINVQHEFAEPIVAGKFMKDMGIIDYGG